MKVGQVAAGVALTLIYVLIPGMGMLKSSRGERNLEVPGLVPAGVLALLTVRGAHRLDIEAPRARALDAIEIELSFDCSAAMATSKSGVINECRRGCAPRHGCQGSGDGLTEGIVSRESEGVRAVG